MITAQVFGVDDCIQAFNELPATVHNRGMRVAMNAGAGVIRDAIVANAPKESGVLRGAIKIRVKIPNASFNKAHHGRPAYAVIGPSRRVVRAVAKTAKGFRRKGAAGIAKAQAKGLAVRVRKPSRYAHVAGPGRRQQFVTQAVASHGEAAKAKVILKIQGTISEWKAKRAAAVLRPILA